MKFQLPFGKETVDCSVPRENLVAVLEPPRIPRGEAQGEIMKKALSSPIGTPLLKEIVRPGEKIALITSDITRPCPSKVVLPPVLEELREAGIGDSDITIIFALGSHRPHTEEEMRFLVGDRIYEGYRCIDHDPLDCVNLGKTSRGTPVDIFRPVVEADRRFASGNIGSITLPATAAGPRRSFPASRRSKLSANHRMMLEEGIQDGQQQG